MDITLRSKVKEKESFMQQGTVKMFNFVVLYSSGAAFFLPFFTVDKRIDY